MRCTLSSELVRLRALSMLKLALMLFLSVNDDADD